jgi:hypothetical protein
MLALLVWKGMKLIGGLGGKTWAAARERRPRRRHQQPAEWADPALKET